MSGQQSYFTQGYSRATVQTYTSRTASSDAAFLLPYLHPSDRILDVGCGPGTITTTLASHVPTGSVTGVDLSEEVLAVARALYADARPDSPDEPSSGEPPASNGNGGCVTFLHADVLEGLPFPDNSFDVVFSSQLFLHLLPPPELPLRAMREMRRVLRPGGLLASRDAIDVHYFPSELGLSRLVSSYMRRSFGLGEHGALAGEGMPRLCRRAGFDVDGGRVVVGSCTTTVAGREDVRRHAQRMAGRLAEGEAFRASWEKAGITAEQIREANALAEKWAETEDAWYVALGCEILAWK